MTINRVLIALLILLSSVLAGAQTTKAVGPKILVFGVDEVKDCAAQITALQQELLTLRYPDNWVIGIACSQIGWDTLRKVADFHESDSAFTNFGKRSTVINGDIFGRFRSQYRHVLAHELDISPATAQTRPRLKN